MDFLDIRTIVCVGVVTDVICTLVLAALWHQNRTRFAGMAFWAADFFLQTVGLMLIVLRGFIPDWMSIILANALVAGGALLGYLGLERFVGKRSSHAHNVLLVVTFVLVQAFLTYGTPNLWARSLNVAVILLLITSQCAWLLLWKVDAAIRPLTRRVGTVFGSYCLFFFVRIVVLLLRPSSSPDYFHSGASESAFHIIMQVLFILLTYSLGLMVNMRLLMAIKLQEEKYSKAFHSSPYGMILTRVADGKIFEANPGFAKFSGFVQKEILGKTTFDLSIWAHIEERREVVEELMAHGSVKGVERTFKRKTGELVIGLFSAETLTINGETCIVSSIVDISERRRAEAEREKLVLEREKALCQLKVLNGLLPICASCKKIRDDKGYWSQLEVYITQHSEADFSHSLCPECMWTLYPEFAHAALAGEKSGEQNQPTSFLADA